MERLKGKTILIGKEPGQGRLLIAIDGKTAVIGTPNTVPNCVSRCKVSEGMAHAKIEVDAKGNMILTNMKPQNVTFVNGSEIMSKHIVLTNYIELGKDHFNINLPVIIETAKKIVGELPETYNIKHLKLIYCNYHDSLKKIRDRQKHINLIRSGCGIFTMCAMPCIYFLGHVGYILTGIGILGNIYSFIGLKNDNTSDEVEHLTDEFQDHYVCPNPKCNKFLGNISYKLLKKQYSMHCPHCKCQYIEE